MRKAGNFNTNWKANIRLDGSTHCELLPERCGTVDRHCREMSTNEHGSWFANRIGWRWGCLGWI